MESARNCYWPKQRSSLCSIFLSFIGLGVQIRRRNKRRVTNWILCNAADLNQWPVWEKDEHSNLQCFGALGVRQGARIWPHVLAWHMSVIIAVVYPRSKSDRKGSNLKFAAGYTADSGWTSSILIKWTSWNRQQQIFLIRISISRNIWWEANQRPDIFCLAFSFHKQLLQRVDCCFLWAMTRNIVLSNRSARAFINFSFQCKLELADWNRVKRKTYWNRSKSRSASESLLWAVLVIIDLYQR